MPPNKRTCKHKGAYGKPDRTGTTTTPKTKRAVAQANWRREPPKITLKEPPWLKK